VKENIDDIDRRLSDWIGSILEQVEVSLALPGESKTARNVGLFLLDLVHNPASRGARRPPIQIMLRYLVTTQADKPEEAHQMLGELVIAALQEPDFEVEQEPLPLSLWSALGVAPRPSFVLRVPFRHERIEKPAPPVRQPLVIKQSPLLSLSGQVLGPENIPIMDAQVELPGLQLHTNTDFKGRFHFYAVPSEPRPKLLRVRAKGKEFSINTEQTESDNGPILIHLQLEE
jgi:hypothetical protein